MCSTGNGPYGLGVKLKCWCSDRSQPFVYIFGALAGEFEFGSMPYSGCIGAHSRRAGQGDGWKCIKGNVWAPWRASNPRPTTCCLTHSRQLHLAYHQPHAGPEVKHYKGAVPQSELADLSRVQNAWGERAIAILLVW